VDLTMALSRDAVLLRIFIGEDDKADHRPLYEAIVLKAGEMHLAGATVLRGPMGFGHSSVLHTTKIVRLSQDLPLVIEIVDSEEAINKFVDAISHHREGQGDPVRHQAARLVRPRAPRRCSYLCFLLRSARSLAKRSSRSLSSRS
jgi:uncharacterized protein